MKRILPNLVIDKLIFIGGVINMTEEDFVDNVRKLVWMYFLFKRYSI